MASRSEHNVAVFSEERIDFWQGFRKPQVIASVNTKEIQELYGSSSSGRSPSPVLRVNVAGRPFDLLLLESSKFMIQRIRPLRLLILARALREAINRQR